MTLQPTSSDAYLPTEVREFPEGFLWGTACAAHQVEGGNVNNDWWAWEHDVDSPCVASSGDACDYWNRYEEDYDLLVGAGGQTVHRFSLEWSRIEPAEGEFSEVALDRYRAMCDALLERGIQPMVTFHHFTTPLWALQDDGWQGSRIVERFGRFVEKAAAALGPDRLPYSCTINEPGVVASVGYFLGLFPPGLRDVDAQARVTANMIRAHAVAVEAIRTSAPDTSVGVTLSMSDSSPHDPEDENAVAMVELVRWRMEDVYVAALRDGTISGLGPAVEDCEVAGLVGTSDYVGCQYYMRLVLDPNLEGFQVPEPPGSELTLMGYASYPPGLGNVVRRCAGSGLPVIVTENGMATEDDRRRCAWIAAHLNVAHETLSAGVDLRGYVYWSTTDNFEWALGYLPKFGLIGIDRENGLARQPRPSLAMFGEIAASNRLDPELVARYVGS